MSENVYPLGISEPEISSDKDKIWEDDVLGRKIVADALTKLVMHEEGPLVVSLDGGWGTGKTFILKRWRRQLEEEHGFEAIYYNAWEDDFHRDPIVSIIGRLPMTGKGVWKNIRGALSYLIRNINPNINVGPMGASINIKNILNSMKNEFEDMHEFEGKGKFELRKNLAELSKFVKEKTDQPLIFIIDELDRCRPTFSVELLERIKHIFDVPNMIFVLGINKVQLCKSIKSIYGDIDSEVYLQRIIDMSFVIPKLESGKYCSSFINKHIARSTILNNQISFFKKELPVWAVRMDLSLRDVQRCVQSIMFVLKNIGNTDRLIHTFICMLIILRIKNGEMYTKYVANKCSGAEVMNYICDVIANANTAEDNNLTDDLNQLESCLYAFGQKNSAREDIKKLRSDESSTSKFLSDRIKSADKDAVDSIIDTIGRIERGVFAGSLVRDMLNIIELISVDAKD